MTPAPTSPPTPEAREPSPAPSALVPQSWSPSPISSSPHSATIRVLFSNPVTTTFVYISILLPSSLSIFLPVLPPPSVLQATARAAFQKQRAHHLIPFIESLCLFPLLSRYSPSLQPPPATHLSSFRSYISTPPAPHARTPGTHSDHAVSYLCLCTHYSCFLEWPPTVFYLPVFFWLILLCPSRCSSNIMSPGCLPRALPRQGWALPFRAPPSGAPVCPPLSYPVGVTSLYTSRGPY